MKVDTRNFWCYIIIIKRKRGDDDLPEKENENSRLAQVLIAARGDRTNKEWAEELGVSPSTITRWIQGSVQLKPKNIELICRKGKVFNDVTFDKLMDAAGWAPPKGTEYVDELNKAVSGIRNLFSDPSLSTEEQKTMLDALSSASDLYQNLYEWKRGEASEAFRNFALEHIEEKDRPDPKTLKKYDSVDLRSWNFIEIPDFVCRYEAGYKVMKETYLPKERAYRNEEIRHSDVESDFYFMYRYDRQSRYNELRLESRLRAIARDQTDRLYSEDYEIRPYLLFEDEHLYGICCSKLRFMKAPEDLSLQLYLLDVQNHTIKQSSEAEFIYYRSPYTDDEDDTEE